MQYPIQLENVTCQFGGAQRQITALDSVNLDIARGSFVAIMGATGSGKSTLLNCAAALDQPTAGHVKLLGHDVTEMRESAIAELRRDNIGFVFQSYNLLSELTVEQNILLPQRLGAKGCRPLANVLHSVGLGDFEQRPVGELSGGQRQRVAIARALVTNPKIVFADEPTGALDPSTGSQILDLLRRSVDELGVTIVMVTHDPRAATYSDRLVMLNNGRIREDGPTPQAAVIAQQLKGLTNNSVGAKQ